MSDYISLLLQKPISKASNLIESTKKENNYLTFDLPLNEHSAKSALNNKINTTKEKVFELLTNIKLDESLMKVIESEAIECFERIKEVKSKSFTYDLLLRCISYYIISKETLFQMTKIDLLRELCLKKKDYIKFNFLLKSVNYNLIILEKTDIKEIAKTTAISQPEPTIKHDSFEILFTIITQTLNKIKSDLSTKLFIQEEKLKTVNLIENVAEKRSNIQAFFQDVNYNDNQRNKQIMLIDDKSFINSLINSLFLNSEKNRSLFENFIPLRTNHKNSFECVSGALIKNTYEKCYQIKISCAYIQEITSHSKSNIAK